LQTNPSIALEKICRQYKIALLYLFGSQCEAGLALLSGQPAVPSDPLTDLDVGVVTADPLPPSPGRAKLYAALYNELEDLVRPFRLDLVFLEENHSVFQAEALKGRCLYAVSAEKQDEYEMNILRRAADFRPFLERYLEEALEEI
jgi:uncharacterized protein